MLSYILIQITVYRTTIVKGVQKSEYTMRKERRRGNTEPKEVEKGAEKDRRPPLPSRQTEFGYIIGMNDNEDAMRQMDDSEWTTTWGDLMMTMFVLFAMLFIYKQSERDIMEAFRYTNEKGTGGTGHGVTQGDRQMMPELLPGFSPDNPDGIAGTGLSPETILQLAEDAVNQTNLDDVQVLLQDDNTIKISLRGPLLFDLGSAELRSETKSFLSKVASILAKMNNEVHVVGHTDTFPIHSDIFPTNWELSVVRAAAIARYLIQIAELNPGRFTIMGHSMYQPALPNTTLENKQLNRRVEIIITKKSYKDNPLR